MDLELRELARRVEQDETLLPKLGAMLRRLGKTMEVETDVDVREKRLFYASCMTDKEWKEWQGENKRDKVDPVGKAWDPVGDRIGLPVEEFLALARPNYRFVGWIAEAVTGPLELPCKHCASCACMEPNTSLGLWRIRRMTSYNGQEKPGTLFGDRDRPYFETFAPWWLRVAKNRFIACLDCVEQPKLCPRCVQRREELRMVWNRERTYERRQLEL